MHIIFFFLFVGLGEGRLTELGISCIAMVFWGWVGLVGQKRWGILTGLWRFRLGVESSAWIDGVLG